MKTKVIVVVVTFLVVFGNTVQGQKITIPENGTKLSLSKFDKKISNFQTFEVENNRDKAGAILMITFNDSCKVVIQLPEIEKGKSHIVKTTDIAKESKDCFQNQQVTATVAIGKDILKGRFAPILNEIDPEALKGRPSITILKNGKLTLIGFDRKISTYEMFEVKNNRDKGAGLLAITFNDSCKTTIQLPEIEKGKYHIVRTTDIPKESKDCFRKMQVTATVTIGKDIFKGKFAPIKDEIDHEALKGKPTITILKDNKLNLVGFGNDKKLGDFVVRSQQEDAVKPKITLSFENDCEVKLVLHTLNKDESYLFEMKSLEEPDKKCYTGTLKKIAIEFGKEKLEKKFADSDLEQGEDELFFTPANEQKFRWLYTNENCASAAPPLSDHTRFALIYDFDCPDFITMWENKKNSVVQTKKIHPKYYRSVLLLVKNFHPYRDSISVAVSYSDRFLEHAGTFTTAFNTNLNLSNSEDTDNENVGKKASRDGKDKTIIEKFEVLRDQLKNFYATAWNQKHLSVAYLDRSVSHINSRLNEVLEIADYSPNGIIDVGLKHVGKLPPGSSAEDFIEIVRAAARYYELIVSYRIFDSHSFLIKNRDEINFQVNKFHDKKKVTLEQEEKNLEITGGVKIDFSLGLFATGLMDKMFTSTSVSLPNDTTFLSMPNGVIDYDSIVGINRSVRKDSILRDNRGRFGYGPAVFSHVYWRSGSFINIGATFGFSIDQQATPRYLLGGSIMLGNNQRFVMSGGVAFGQRKQLASGLKEGQLITLSSYPNSTLPTTDRSDTSWFFSISYNFAGFSVGGTHD